MGLSGVFKTMFPFISAAASLGGPLGTMAAAEIGKALKIDNVDMDKIDQTLATAQSKDPDAMLKLQSAEQEFQLKMTQLGFDSAAKLEEIAAGDRASARQREVAVRDKMPMILGLCTTFGFFAMLTALVFHAVPQESRELLSAMTGTLGTMAVGINTYFFGSSAGSARKTDVISGQLK